MKALIEAPTISSVENHVEANAVRPSAALLFYTRAGQLAMTTAHDISFKKGVALLEPGKPLSPEEEARIVSMLMDREVEGAASRVRINPPNVLHSDAASTTWLCPSRVAPMVLRTHESDKTVFTRWPTMVMHARNRQLYVASLASDKWPGPDTEIFHAPMANVWANQMVCTGSAVLPLGCAPSDIDGWLAAFFESAFTHQNHGEAITIPAKGKSKVKAIKRSGAAEGYADPMKYWAGRDGKHDPFPESHLTPLKMTLGDWISQLIFAGASRD